MKIRTQLIAAFLLLAIVPLASLVVHSYFTSVRAVQRAVEADSSELTAEMEERMGAIKEDLDRRVARLGRLPLGMLMRGPDEASPEEAFLFRRMVSEIGEAAPLFESFTLAPAAPPPPGPPGAPRPPGPPGAPRPPGVVIVGEKAEVELPEAPEALPVHELQPLIIDFPRLVEELGEMTWEEAASDDETLEIETEIPELDFGGLGRGIAETVAAGMEAAMEALREIEREAAEEGDEERRHELERGLHEIERQRHRLEQRAEISADRAERARAVAAMRAEEEVAMAEKRRETKRLLGRDLGAEIRSKGETVGEFRAQVSTEALLGRVLHSTPRNHGEVPFALDAEGRLYPAEADDLPLLESLELTRDPETGKARAGADSGDWQIVSLADPESGLLFGIAHPLGESLAEIRRATALNLGLGLGLICLALLGIVPLSRRITRGLETVTAGAERIARGDLETQVPVESDNEVGQLAAAFNRMAGDLREHQERLLREEGRRKSQELEKRFLEAEFQRKSRELEDARVFQLSLLPKQLPRHPACDVAVDMQTAAEVGGDYYDFHLADDGTLTLAIGDATGHGARAGTMVTVIKSLFSARAADVTLADFLQQATATIKRMDLGRMAMALTVARFDGDSLTVSAAGMPPVLIWRAASGEVEEIALAGMPLGGLASDYQEKRVRLDGGDVVLLLSDGLPELPDPAGEPLGYRQVRALFAAAAGKAPGEVIAELTEAAERWTGGQAWPDDITLMVLEKKRFTDKAKTATPPRPAGAPGAAAPRSP